MLRISPSAFRLPPSALFLLLLLAACRPAESPRDAPPASPLAGVKLRLAVADDPAVAAAVRRLRDEWNAQTGSELEVSETTEKDLLAADRLPADAVICPSHLLAPLAERDWIAPVPGALCPEDHGPWSEVFDVLRLDEVKWRGRAMAVPLGSPVLCVYYRADLLARLNRRPPQTWPEYLELARLMREQMPADDSEKTPSRFAVAEPLAPGWAGLTLLARAAPYAKHPSNYSALFDIQTMEPLVAGPPFIRALEELVAAAKLAGPERLTYDPAATRAAFWNGQCAMALSWPTAALITTRSVSEARPGTTAGVAVHGLADASGYDGSSLPGKSGIDVGFAELPGSPQVYSTGSRAWEDRPPQSESRVPLLGMAGRIGVARAGQEGPEAAMHLLLWLSDPQRSVQVCADSPATTLFRNAHVASPGDWVEKPVAPRAAAAYANLTRQSLRRQQSLWAVRLPGRAEYLAALDEAVHSAVQGTQTPAEALDRAAARWREITARLGLEKQKAAYRHGLGLE